MPDSNAFDFVMPQLEESSVRRRRGVNLWLPQSPSFGYESDFDLEITSNDIPSPPFSAGSAGHILVSRFSDDSSEGGYHSASLSYASEDWECHSDTVAQVTVEGDGSQLIHIPYESPFYLQPNSPHSVGLRTPPRNTPLLYTPLSPSLSSPSSTSSCSASMLSPTPRDAQTPLLIISTVSSPQDEAMRRDKRPRPALLFVDTAFLSAPNSSTGLVFPTLSASCYFSSGSSSGSGASWGSDRNYYGDLDVPQSAITPHSPLDFWDQVCLFSVTSSPTQCVATAL
ncbi:hypothetical protein FA13DRAFT_726258 [Coprinellus micaceus]|uniref:Uncharacterized protein n=1 Tax=Coprinellus micaceus TaxID=71717 RepID=A0A4Y7TVD2_COPMI|nr:hypothetical protein FA13DRAFT_726258 [Coprinellus micaceus]